MERSDHQVATFAELRVLDFIVAGRKPGKGDRVLTTGDDVQFEAKLWDVERVFDICACDDEIGG